MQIKHSFRQIASFKSLWQRKLTISKPATQNPSRDNMESTLSRLCHCTKHYEKQVVEIDGKQSPESLVYLYTEHLILLLFSIEYYVAS